MLYSWRKQIPCTNSALGVDQIRRFVPWFFARLVKVEGPQMENSESGLREDAKSVT